MLRLLNQISSLFSQLFPIRVLFAALALVTFIPTANFAITKFDFGGARNGTNPIADYTYVTPSFQWAGFTAGPLPGGVGITVSHILGNSGSRMAPADYDGDSFTDFAVFNAGTWTISYNIGGSPITGGASANYTLGAAGNIPQSANFTGNNQAEIAVYDNGTWLFQALPGHTPLPAPNFPPIPNFGTVGDKPVTADYDGDGFSDQAIYRPSNGQWWIRSSNTGLITVFNWGIMTDTPVPADYDGNGLDDIAVFRNGVWYIWTGSMIVKYWGIPGDLPVPADYDGDGKDDDAIYRTPGQWWIDSSGNGQWVIFAVGAAGDEPVPHAYIQ